MLDSIHHCRSEGSFLALKSHRLLPSVMT